MEQDYDYTRSRPPRACLVVTRLAGCGEWGDGMTTFGSLFSGIGGFDLGFERAGLSCAWQCEIDKPAQEVLKKHFKVEVYNDVKKITKNNSAAVNVICGGFPCQDVSVAGRRAGLAGERSGLWHEFHRIVAEHLPRWVVIENVPGLLSSNDGKDFAVILRGLVECGYRVAWRILDSQYFGVPQRRRRVFIVASLGNGSCVEVLFEREGVPGYTPPRRETGKGFAAVAGTLASSGGGLDRPAGNANELDFCVPVLSGTQSSTQNGKSQQLNELDFILPSIVSNGDSHSGFRDEKGLISMHETGNGFWTEGLPGLRAQPGGMPENMILQIGVRRLTPIECSRLQGFPDDWNDWLKDTQRYKQFGNAVTVNVAEWIGNRIMQAEKAETP